ncbi:MAG: hypothetical protein WCF65_01955 [Parachlamydiaceae bacterium]
MSFSACDLLYPDIDNMPFDEFWSSPSLNTATGPVYAQLRGRKVDVVLPKCFALAEKLLALGDDCIVGRDKGAAPMAKPQKVIKEGATGHKAGTLEMPILLCIWKEWANIR